MNKIRALLPWYINHSLSNQERLSVESWLRSDPEAVLDYDSVLQIANAVREQEEATPSYQVRARIVDNIRQPNQPLKKFSQWIWGVPLAIFFFSILWLIIQPGNQLQWSVSRSEVVAFRIYRAPAGETNFALVNELPATPAQQNYQFVDPLLMPGLNYNYAIEVMDQFGNTSISRVASSNSMMVLATQIAILLTSIFLAFGMITIADEITSLKQLKLIAQ